METRGQMDASLAGRAENASSDVAQSVRSAPAAASFFTEGVQPWQDCACPLPPDRLQALITGLQQIVPEGSVLYRQEDLRPYECDGLSAYRQLPPVVVLPSTEEQVRQIILLCRRLEVPLVPRGAGTGLTGSAMPHAGGVLMSMARFNQILSLDAHARTARVQPGVRNLAISEAASAFGLFYAPDPSSQIACTIGGNVAENSGGVHCLKYGLTVHNVLAVRGFTIDGEPITLGSTLPGAASAPAATTESVALDTPGLDLLGACIGSEGMLMVVTEVVVKLLPTPRLARVIMASFDDVETAGNAVAAVIAAGLIPAGMEMMDRQSTQAVEPFVRAGYDLEAAAILLVESDGTAEEVAEEIAAMEAVLRKAGATRLQVSHSEAERMRFWSGRKNAFPAAGRISADYYCMDGTIPKHKLGQMLMAIAGMEKKYGLLCMNVFHAGDGNLHPLILFDSGKPGGTVLRRRDPGAVRGAGRHHHRRTRRGHREDQLDVRAVLRGRACRVLCTQARLRSARAAQPRQGHSHAAPLRRIRPHARPAWPAEVS